MVRRDEQVHSQEPSPKAGAPQKLFPAGRFKVSAKQRSEWTVSYEHGQAQVIGINEISAVSIPEGVPMNAAEIVPPPAMKAWAEGGQDVMRCGDALSHAACLHEFERVGGHRRIAAERQDLGRFPKVFKVLDVILVEIRQQESIYDLSAESDRGKPWP